MRMWMVDPKILCRNHLLGEYRELFTIIATLKKNRRIDGYIKNNCIEPLSISSRYKQLRKEMLRRAYHPQKKFEFSDKMLDYLPEKIRKYRIKRKDSLNDLIDRCKECSKQYNT